MKITSNNVPKINSDRKINQQTDNRVKIDDKFNEIMKTKLAEETKKTETAQQKPVIDKGANVPTNATQQASHMKEIVTSIKNVPDGRAARIEEIKAKIANGTYNVSSEELADKLINSGFINGLLKSL